MKQRIITGTVLGVVALLLFGAAFFFSPVMNGLLLCIGIVALYEFFKATDLKKYHLLANVSYLFLLVYNVLIYFNRYEFLVYAILIYFIAGIAALLLYNMKCTFAELAKAFVLTLYVTVGFSSLLLLYQMFGDIRRGFSVVVLVIVASWACDIGGWLFGSLFGKHKLCPEISPKKTFEGLLGSVVFALAAFALYYVIVSNVFPEAPPALWKLLVCALPFAIVELGGDLFASVIKREHNIKDFGTIFPAHGGIMDRFDGIALTSIYMYILIRLAG